MRGLEDRIDSGSVLGMYAHSQKGPREKDEDYIACGQFQDIRVGVLCDGMGGESFGEVASKRAATSFVRGVSKVRGGLEKRWSKAEARYDAYDRVIDRCHRIVDSIDPDGGRSGTTLTAVVISKKRGAPAFADIVHLGDSRCYRIGPSGGRELLTDDHSITGGMVRAGYIELHEIPKTAGNNALTRHIGDEDGSKAVKSTIEPSQTDSFLICCDGVWGPLHGQEGFWLPRESAVGQQMVGEIVAESLARGSTDNCSALLVEASEE